MGWRSDDSQALSRLWVLWLALILFEPASRGSTLLQVFGFDSWHWPHSWQTLETAPERCNHAFAPVTAITEAEDGRILVTTAACGTTHLWQFQGDAFTSLYAFFGPACPVHARGPEPNPIHCILTGPEGKIWLGAADGLHVVEGNQGRYIRAYDAPPPGMVTMAAPGDAMVDAVGFGPIVDLAQDAKGRLWVVTAKEGLVGAFSPDFPLDRPPLAGRMFGFPTGTDEYRFIQESDVCAIEPDKAGDVWAVTNRFAVLRFPVQAQHWHWEVVQEGLALPPAQAMQMGPVKEKGFLVLARSGDLSSLRYFDRETDTWESWQTPSAQGFAVAPNGTVYFAAGVEGLFSLANGQLNKPAINEELAQDDHYQPDRTKPDMTTVIPVNLVFCDSQGNLWIANGHYLWKFQP